MNNKDEAELTWWREFATRCLRLPPRTGAMLMGKKFVLCEMTSEGKLYPAYTNPNQPILSDEQAQELAAEISTSTGKIKASAEFLSMAEAMAVAIAVANVMHGFKEKKP